MTPTIPDWSFTILPVFLMLAALFWGAPLIALINELASMISGKPFPARCGQQMTRLGVSAHAGVWLFVTICMALLWDHPVRSSEFVANHQLMMILVILLPFLGTLLLAAYNATWKTSKQKRATHFALGCLANIPLKYAYWGSVILILVAIRGIPFDTPAFIPPAVSALWPAALLWIPVSLFLTAGLGLCYLLLRRKKDDWGRDYYRFAAPFLAKWTMATGVCIFLVEFWLWVSLTNNINLYLPQIFLPCVASVICQALSMALALKIAASEHPMRLKGSMLGIMLLTYLQLTLLSGAIFETASRYVAGWSLPTFLPSLISSLPL